MIHLGDITKINGAEIPPVDCVTGGSPCQDLSSAAGKRAGLNGARSGLFMEQIRVIKEMRERDIKNGRTADMARPRYMVWENVPGAFSSNGGEDFRIVLEETARIADKDAAVPRPPKGRWTPSGCIVGDGWSIAWRVHDAQFWGVPQRRKRIALVADFGGLSAPEVQFERKGLFGYAEQSGETRQEAAGAAGAGAAGAISFQERAGRPGGGKGILIQNERTGALSTLNNQSVFCLQGNGIDRADTAGCNGRGWKEDVSYTLNTIDRPAVAVTQENGCLNPWDVQSKHIQPQDGIAEALYAGECRYGGGESYVMAFKQGQGAKAGSVGAQEECAPTLSASESGTNRVPAVIDARGNGDGETVPTITGDHENRITDYTAVCIGNGQAASRSYQDVTGTLSPGAHPGGCNGQDAYNDMLVAAVDCRNGTENSNVNGTLQAKSNGGTSYNLQNVCRVNAVVRRLTPLECERLQGYPDGWTDIGDWTDSKGKKRKTSDSARYKALGNSIALPFWFWLLRRISAQYERPATLGSLFDGIGGFPLCWERCNGIGTAVWASEVDEFCIAVTRARFGE